MKLYVNRMENDLADTKSLLENFRTDKLLRSHLLRFSIYLSDILRKAMFCGELREYLFT